METPEVTKERILLLRRGVIVLFAVLAGLIIGHWRADGRTEPEIVKAEVKVKKTDGFQIFEFRPMIAIEGEEAYVKVVGDEEYPKGNLTTLYQPRIRLEPTIAEPDMTPRPVRPEKPTARAPRTKQTSRHPLPPLPPANFLK